jgi:hypothetical protein
MTSFTVYVPATGEILRSGFVLSAADAAEQAGPGESVLVGARGNPSEQRVDVTATPPVLIPITP